MKELSIIQHTLNAPKDLFNNFGKYKYRSCEGILSALKPLLKDHDCCLVLEDEMVEVGGRVYVKSKATITCGDSKESATAYAREPESKKGMDESQITGAASSYARKYALNGLFAIDDTKDPDATNTHGKKDTDTKNLQVVYDELQEGVDKCKNAKEIDSFCSTNKKKIYSMGEQLTDKFRLYVRDLKAIFNAEHEEK